MTSPTHPTPESGSERERIEQIELFIKANGYRMLHASDIEFLIKLAKRVAK